MVKIAQDPASGCDPMNLILEKRPISMILPMENEPDYFYLTNEIITKKKKNDK